MKVGGQNHKMFQAYLEFSRLFSGSSFPFGTATPDDLPADKPSTASQLSHCGVIFSSLRMAETHTNWGSGLE